MAGKKWQALERSIAKIFNTKRTPFSGSNSGLTASDTLHNHIFVEAKCHKNQAVINLMQATEELAKKEGKIPILALQDPEDKKHRKYLLIEVKDLKKIVKEIDVHFLDQRVPEGTTIQKLLMSSEASAADLIDLREQITIEIKKLFRQKVVTDGTLDKVEVLSTMKFMIDNVLEYSREKQANEQRRKRK